jgi:hypothetical protein
LEDAIDGTTATRGHPVTHIIPPSVLDKPEPIRTFIQSLIPLADTTFFDQIDTPDNAILLNYEAHKHFGNFLWFIRLEEGTTPNENVFIVTQVQDNGLLGSSQNLGRHPMINGERYTSSFNKKMFVGLETQAYKRPDRLFLKIHELVSRILHMKGGVEEKDMFDNDDDESERSLINSKQMDLEEKLRYFFATQERIF